MKFAFVLLHTQFYRHFDRIVRILCGKGYSADIVVEWIAKPNLTDRVLVAAQSQLQSVAFAKPLYRKDRWMYLVHFSRELLNYSSYFHPQHPSKNLSTRWKKYFSESTWRLLEKKWAIKLLLQWPVQYVLRLIEQITPPVKSITNWLKEAKPDVIILSPLLPARSMELEYLKSAKSLGIPTVYALASWDNLTTKGTIHIQSDLVFVWNQPLKEEAITLHSVPADRIVITGSPTFDYWFQVKPSQSREEFCRTAGFDPKRPYIVYLCSSRGMIEDETTFILELAAKMCDSPLTQNAVLLVRPHPYNMLDLSVLNRENVCVFPKQGDLPDVDDAKQVYFDTLHYSAATVGVNTSAMLEAAIADKPCVTIIDERYRRSQTDMGHFRHLINGDYLEVTDSAEQAVSVLVAVLAGQDKKKDKRRRFVSEFIRPHGLDRSASEIFAQAVELAAQHKTAAEIMAALKA